MERFDLQSNVRGDSGKGVARKLREDGRLPAVLYGRREAPLGLSLSETDVRNILRKHPDSAIPPRAAFSTSISSALRSTSRFAWKCTSRCAVHRPV